MVTLFGIILRGIIWLIIIAIFFNIVVKFIEGKNAFVDYVIDKVKIFFKKCYEYFRQRICKKSNEVNDDTGTDGNYTEPYDSSSEWQD